MNQYQFDFPIIDAHVHFLSQKTQAATAKLWSRGNPKLIEEDKKRRNQHAARLHNPPWEFADLSGRELAGKWLAELDKNNINQAVFLCLAPDAPDFEEFIRVGGKRFFGFTTVDPLDTEAVNQLEGRMQKAGFCGLKLFPALQRFKACDAKAYPLYELAEQRGWPIIFHMGLTLAYFADIRYTNPLNLQPVARDFPRLNIIVPHFGTGYLQESLFLAYHCSNVYFDSSSSNIWLDYLPYPLTLKEVFEKFISLIGHERIIFGTDSSYFPRGYRSQILNDQLGILQKLPLKADQLKNILGGNILRLLHQT
jgi:predicted TIM-barrel fold metal-dependent hydrolase